MHIFLAASEGDLATIKACLANNTVDINDVDQGGKTALFWGSLYGQQEVVSALLSKGADTEVKEAQGERTALLGAACEGHGEVVRLLLDAKACGNTQDKHGDTALCLAAKKGHLAIVKRLLEAGADPNLHNKQRWAPLHQAVAEEHLEVVKVLVTGGAMLESKNVSGSTPLMMAAINNHYDIVETLCESGADVNALDGGNTALHYAVQNNQLEAVQVLLKYKPKLCQNRRRKTPLDIAKEEGYDEIVSLLSEDNASDLQSQVNQNTGSKSKSPPTNSSSSSAAKGSSSTETVHEAKAKEVLGSLQDIENKLENVLSTQ